MDRGTAAVVANGTVPHGLTSNGAQHGCQRNRAFDILGAVRGAVRAIAGTLRARKDDVSLATTAARDVFPAQETELIGELIRRDLPFYDPLISEKTVTVMNRFCRDMGVLRGMPAYADVVAVDIITAGCKA